MPSRALLAYTAVLPDRRSVHRVSSRALTFCVAARSGTRWTAVSWCDGQKRAERYAGQWRRQLRDAILRDPGHYETRTVKVKASELPPTSNVYAVLPGNARIHHRYWPTLGESRPVGVVVAPTGRGWKPVGWPTNEVEVEQGLKAARQKYLGADPQVLPVYECKSLEETEVSK